MNGVVNSFLVVVVILMLRPLMPSDNIISRKQNQPQLGPNGENCIHIHSSTYDYTDRNGLQCECELCQPGERLVKNCTCDPNSPQPSKCEYVMQGRQFMNARNNCSQGFLCKECLHPLKVKTPCPPNGPDTECSCADEGHYMIPPDVCKPFPRCDAEYEPRQGNGTEYICQLCLEGYFQPKNNSTAECQKIRKCTVQNGTSHSDAVCLNDPVHSLPTDDDVVTEETTITSSTTDEPVSTPASSVTNNQPSVSSDAPTNKSSTGEPTSWLIIHHYIGAYIAVPSFTLGIVFGIFLKDILNYFRSCPQRGSYVLAVQDLTER